MDNKILVTRSSMPTLDEYIEEIRSIWDSHWLTNMGVKHKQLQAQLEEFWEFRMWLFIQMAIWHWRMLSQR